MTPEIIERINSLINNDVSIDQFGLIEKTEFAKNLRTHIAVIKAGKADMKSLMKVLLREFKEDKSDELAITLSKLDRDYFKNTNTFKSSGASEEIKIC